MLSNDGGSANPRAEKHCLSASPPHRVTSAKGRSKAQFPVRSPRVCLCLNSGEMADVPRPRLRARIDPIPGLAANPRDSLGLHSRAPHVELHCGVESPPGLPQLRGKRRAELALEAPHQRLAHCDILRWLNAKSGVLAT